VRVYHAKSAFSSNYDRGLTCDLALHVAFTGRHVRSFLSQWDIEDIYSGKDSAAAIFLETTQRFPSGRAVAMVPSQEFYGTERTESPPLGAISAYRDRDRPRTPTWQGSHSRSAERQGGAILLKWENFGPRLRSSSVLQSNKTCIND